MLFYFTAFIKGYSPPLPAARTSFGIPAV